MTEIPSSWSLVTNLNHQLIYQQTEAVEDNAKKTLILLNDDRPSTWKVKGLLGFNTEGYEDSKYPIFADNTTLDQAKAVAHDVMDADSDISPIRKEALVDRTENQDKGNPNGKQPTNTNESEEDATQDSTNTESKSNENNNAELSDFM